MSEVPLNGTMLGAPPAHEWGRGGYGTPNTRKKRGVRGMSGGKLGRREGAGGQNEKGPPRHTKWGPQMHEKGAPGARRRTKSPERGVWEEGTSMTVLMRFLVEEKGNVARSVAPSRMGR